jgi:hypothetical protein
MKYRAIFPCHLQELRYLWWPSSRRKCQRRAGCRGPECSALVAQERFRRLTEIVDETAAIDHLYGAGGAASRVRIINA